METHPLETLSEMYLSSKKFAIATLKSYRIAYKHYIHFLKLNDIYYAETKDVIRYRHQKREKGDSTHYIYIHIAALKGLYRFLEQNQKQLHLPEVYAYNIMTPIKNERMNYQVTKPILTLEEARHLLLSMKANRKSIWHYRNYAIVYLMLVSALRRFEIVGAFRKDYITMGKLAILKIRKEGKEVDVIPLADGARLAIDDYLARRKDTLPYLFVTTKNTSPSGNLSRTFFRDMFRKVLKDNGLEKTNITPHCLRHTAAMLNLERGGSLIQTKLLMRHQSMDSTIVYKERLYHMRRDDENQIEHYILGDHPSD